MSDTLQSAQQALQQAGQKTAQKSEDEASEEDMGAEFGSSGQSSGQPSGQAAGQAAGAGQQGQASTGGSSSSGGNANGNGKKMDPSGGRGRAAGGGAGPQQPLPGQKQDSLVKGSVNPRGEHTSRTYKGTPDPTRDRAAYYQVVPEQIRSAEATLNREEIPSGYKNQVRKYFNSIQPN